MILSRALTSELTELETPLYYYDLSLLQKTIDIYTFYLNKYGYHAHYALKANANEPVIERMRAAGLGADCVSGNEVALALKCRFDPKKVIFAGVGKSDKEIVTGLKGGIFSFNCESIPEIEVIEGLAAGLGLTASITLRVNPNIDAHTHKYITTGRSQDKFGISPSMFDEVWNVVSRSKHLRLLGLHFHIGSQITDLNIFKALCDRVNTLQGWFLDKGVRLELFNLGGGLGVDYESPFDHPIPDFARYFELIHKHLRVLPHQEVHFEPGRALVAQCGFLLSRVLYVKRDRGVKFAILDAGMNDLIRPALYGARHHILNLSSTGRMMRYHVVGPVCESSDCFGKSILLSECKRGDLIALCTCGAYGQVMSMRYNQRDLAGEVYGPL